MTGYDVGYGNGDGQLAREAAQTAFSWAKEPCPSQQPVTLPLDYVVNGERCRGALIGAAVVLVGFAYYLSKKFVA